jgi:hypothetical protein
MFRATPRTEMLWWMRSPRRTLIAAAVLLLGLGAGACTSESDSGEPAGSAPDPTATDDAPQLRQRAASYDLSYGRVAGKLGRGKRKQTLRAITKPVRVWVNEGFVDGPWPRKGFEAAFTPFSAGTAKSARNNARLLTMQALGPNLVDVVPQRRRVRVSATAARGRPIGATARVDLAMFGLNQQGSRLSVHVRGDVFLSATKEKGWQIFGYELDRWVERAGGSKTEGGDR